MRRFNALITIVFTSIWLISAGNRPALMGELPEFEMDVIQLKNEGTRTSVDIYTSIPLSNLNFVGTNGGGYKAEYEITVDVFQADERGRAQATILSDSWERQVPARDYDYTRSDQRRDVVKNSLELNSGNYAFQVTLTDRHSGKNFTREIPLWVRDFQQQNFALSDLMLCDHFEPNSLLINPNVSNVISSDSGSLLAFYYAYAQTQAPATIVYSVDKISPNTQGSSLQSLIGQSVSRLSIPLTNVVPQWEERLSLNVGTNQLRVEVPLKNMQPGMYALRAVLKDAQGQVVEDISKVFSLRWSGLIAQIMDVDKSISQLMHIASEDEMFILKNAPTKEERLNLFNAFWKRRDPTPSTERNEAMEEYYQRINYVNREHRFGKREGWQTDQGMVYIRFGEPNFIQRHPFDFGASDAYEIWYYESIGRKFIFIDRSGTGMFELYRPIWDDRNRL